MGPGAPVDVVRPDDGPRVVDDAHLGVHVDRGTRLVLQAVDADPVSSGRIQRLQRLGAAQQVRRERQPAVLIGEGGQDRDEMQCRVLRQGTGKYRRYRGGPQVLVFQVDQGPGARQHLDVAAGDAALPLRRERVTVPPAGVGAQQLDRMLPAPRRRGVLRRQPAGVVVHVAERITQPGQRVAGRRCRVLPASRPAQNRQCGSFTTVTKKLSIWRITSMNRSKSTGLLT